MGMNGMDYSFRALAEETADQLQRDTYDAMRDKDAARKKITTIEGEFSVTGPEIGPAK